MFSYAVAFIPLVTAPLSRQSMDGLAPGNDVIDASNAAASGIGVPGPLVNTSVANGHRSRLRNPKSSV